MMPTGMRLFCVGLLACALWSLPAHGGPETPLEPGTQAEIDFLLDRVQESGYLFVRNGSEHDCVGAARHMRRKYEHFLKEGEIDSVEDFIDLAGTKSLITGRAYLVRLPDGSEIHTADWLRAELAARRASAAEARQ